MSEMRKVIVNSTSIIALSNIYFSESLISRIRKLANE